VFEPDEGEEEEARDCRTRRQQCSKRKIAEHVKEFTEEHEAEREHLRSSTAPDIVSLTLFRIALILGRVDDHYPARYFFCLIIFCLRLSFLSCHAMRQLHLEVVD
jgi:hypothetical protein